MQCLVIHGIQVSPCVINHILMQTCEKYTAVCKSCLNFALCNNRPMLKDRNHTNCWLRITYHQKSWEICILDYYEFEIKKVNSIFIDKKHYYSTCNICLFLVLTSDTFVLLYRMWTSRPVWVGGASWSWGTMKVMSTWSTNSWALTCSRRTRSECRTCTN